MSSSDKILSFIERFEFIAEWLITSKYPNDTNIFHQFLVLVEAVKFYYRVRKFSHRNIFVQEEAVQ
jgi:cytochrome b subunit of formate dehydrogenase